MSSMLLQKGGSQELNRGWGALSSSLLFPFTSLLISSYFSNFQSTVNKDFGFNRLKLMNMAITCWDIGGGCWLLREERAKSQAVEYVTLGGPEGRERSMHASFDFATLGLAYSF